MDKPPADTKGRILVAAQFICIVLLVVGGPWRLPIWAWAIFDVGMLAFLLAFVSLGSSNVTIMPMPRKGNVLTKRGIYRFIRHPMYLAVLLCGAAVTLGAPTPLRWTALGAVLVVLVLKIRHEEHLLHQVHPEYSEVMRGVKRLFPGVW